MSDLPHSANLLQQVTRRLYLARFGRRTFIGLIACGALYLTVLVIGRLTGTLPPWFETSIEGVIPLPWSLLSVPLGALLVGLACSRWPTPADAAREVDRRYGTKDLYLTLTMLEASAGEYKPLVARDAENRAAKLKAAEVVTLDSPSLQRRIAFSAVTVATLLLSVFYIPTLDPFGQQAAAKERENAAKQIAETRKVNEQRKAALAQKNLDNQNSEDVEQAIEKLKADFQKMKAPERKANTERLAVNQKSLGDKWRKLNAGELKDLLHNSDLDQRFGGKEASEMRKWQRELQQGSAESLDQELEELKEDLQQLAKTDDPIKRTEKLKQIEKRLRELSEFASDKAGSKELSAALQRALDQMPALKSGESQKLAEDAMKALQESLELSQAEAQDLAQQARDLKSLEEAMELISMAKQLNGQELLDAEATEGCQSLEDYAELYAQMMEGMEGGELGGEGMGEGGVAPEDDSVETDFVTEKSKSAVQKGKVLLSMKTKGLSDSGEAVQQYRGLVTDIKQTVDEAIEKEDIPPGYIDGIKKYFSTIEKIEPELKTDEPQ